MFFGPKILCEQCGKKAKESASVYRRGSRFCTTACRDTWEAANPPPIARGEPGALRQELIIILDEAFTEAHRHWGPSINVPFGNTQVRVDISLGSIDDRHRAEQMQEAYMQFTTHSLRAAPLLRALGHAREADLIDSTDFENRKTAGLVDALAAVRSQL